MQHQWHIQQIIQSNTEEEEGKGKGKEEKGREAVLYGGTEIEEEQVGVGLQLALVGYSFAPYIGVISASISESIWARGSAIISSFNGFIQAPISVIFTV